VVLVGNPVAPYSRALRIARTLVRAGYTVEIAATAADGLPDEEAGEGWKLRRYPPSGWWARSGRSETSAAAAARNGHPPGGGRRFVERLIRLAAALRRWLFWPHTVRGWWATLDRALEPADLYHACGSLTIDPALRARRASPVGPSGRRAMVIYDAIDDVFESNNVLDMPSPIRAWHARRETGWARAADATITVNEPLAERLAARWGRRPLSVPNYPDLSSGTPFGAKTVAGRSTGETDLIRVEVGLPASTRVVLFVGRLGPRLGLDEAADAVLDIPDAALVLLGFGRWYERERARDVDPRYAGRHFTLPARHPDDLLAWVASADVALVPLPPVSLNQRLSSPNKLWEALAAGVPVVVPAGLSYMAGIVREGDLGVVAASGSAADLAAAIAEALDRLAVDPAWRGRIRAIAGERYAWSVAVATYLDVIRSVAGPPR
jgi:glycosyltransferase involved in cell wall biosynthesis